MKEIIKAMPRHHVRRVISAIVAAIWILAMLIHGTFAWLSISNLALNPTTGFGGLQVQLLKLAKDVDGNILEIEDEDGQLINVVVPGAEFKLYKVEEPDDQQINGIFTTDAKGRISISSLKPGQYYFLETFPSYGYTYDRDEDDKEMKRYDFTVTDEGTVTVDGKEVDEIRVYNRQATGDLLVRKTVKNSDGSDLTEEQRDIRFEFTITFSDDGTYKYTIGDDPKEYEVSSGGTFHLKTGEAAKFVNLPAGVTYTVVETPGSDYHVSGNNHHGQIIPDQMIEVGFVNTFMTKVAEDGRLIVTKQVRNGDGSALTDEQLAQAFEFKVTFSDHASYLYRIDDGTEQLLESGGIIRLKHGEEATFLHLPVGVGYTVSEVASTMPDGYTPTIWHF